MTRRVPTTPTKCLHIWKFRDDLPVLDFGLLGIKVYECRKCGALGESDPSTGAVAQRETPS